MANMFESDPNFILKVIPYLTSVWLATPWDSVLSQDSTGYTVRPVLHGHSKIDKTKILKTNGSLMKVESIAECSLGAFCNTFDLH